MIVNGKDLNAKKTIPEIDEFSTFLKNQTDFLETLELNLTQTDPKDLKKNYRYPLLSNNGNNTCNLCSEPHLICVSKISETDYS